MRHSGPTALALALVLAAAASPARAQVPTQHPPHGGIALAGEEVVWTERTADGTGFVLKTARLGGARRELARLGPARDASRVRGHVVASQARLLLAVHGYGTGGQPLYSEMLTAPLGGALEPVPACSNPLLRHFDVSGDAIVYGPCERGGAPEVRDYSAGSTTQALPGGGFHVRMAGRFVASLDPSPNATLRNISDVVVYDRAAGAEAYRVPAAQMPGEIQSLDVQDDGKVAVAYGQRADERPAKVGWASPAEPRIHALPLPARDSYNVRIAADRIAWQGGRRQNFQVPRATVGVATLEGDSRVLGSPAESLPFQDMLDFDGQRVAWLYRGCRATIYVQEIDGDPRRFDARRCPLTFSSAPKVKSGRIAMAVDCSSFADESCGGRVTVVTATRARTRVAAGQVQTGERSDVELTRAGRALLKRNARLRVVVSAGLADSAGRSEVRRRTLTLRAP